MLAADWFISVISSLDTTGKRDSSSPSGVGKGTFSSGTERCRCSLSDNSTCSVSIRGICKGINDAVVTVGCVSCISSVEGGNPDDKLSSLYCRKCENISKFTLGKISPVRHYLKYKFRHFLKAPAVKGKLLLL